MKRGKVPAAALVVAMAVALALSGCGPASRTGTSETEPGTEPGTAVATEPSAGADVPSMTEAAAGTDATSVTETAASTDAASVAEPAGEELAGEDGYILEDSASEAMGLEDVRGLSPEQARLARNEIYARHGRRFADPELQAYFDGKPWYQGTTDPEEFNEDVLSQVEKDNIRYLKELEPVPGLAGLPEAPSKEDVDRYGYENGHSLLSFSLKAGTVRDCGDYYQVDAVYCQAIEAPGNLAYGDEVTLVFDELTGDTKTLVYRKGEDTYSSGLYDKAAGEYSTQYYYVPSDDKSPVVLYQDSDDRVDKPVLDGKLYIRKDATCEVDIEGQSEPVTYEKLNGEYNWYNGVFFDQKGYVARLVFYGD